MDNHHTPSTLPIDHARLRAARAALDLQILALKRELRARWQRPMHLEQRELLRCKHLATELCILRAWLRGRWHLADHERCVEVATRLAPDFHRAAEVAA
jgi:hypothetical protein